jgi:hypothetical protein
VNDVKKEQCTVVMQFNFMHVNLGAPVGVLNCFIYLTHKIVSYKATVSKCHVRGRKYFSP